MALKKRKYSKISGALVQRKKQFYGRYSGPQSAELKFHDVSAGSTAATLTGVFAGRSLNLIPQGTSESERIGRKCLIKKINMRGSILLANATANNACQNRIRIIVYQDKQANGADITATTDLLETAAIDSYRNLANSMRFKVLYDKTMACNCTCADGTETFEYIKNWSFNRRVNIPLEFSSTTGAISELRSNNIGVLFIQESTAPNAILKYQARLRFSDG